MQGPKLNRPPWTRVNFISDLNYFPFKFTTQVLTTLTHLQFELFDLKFGEFLLRWVLSSDSMIRFGQSHHKFTSSHGHEIRDMGGVKQMLAICHEYGLQSTANSWPMRHSFLHELSLHACFYSVWQYSRIFSLSVSQTSLLNLYRRTLLVHKLLSDYEGNQIKWSLKKK